MQVKQPICVSRSKDSIYKYAFICIFIIGFLRIVQRYPWTARVCVDWVHFPDMLSSGSDAGFLQCHLVVLRVHILSVYAETCIRRTAGRCCRNFVSDREESMGK